MVKDSGTRETYASGAMRDNRTGKGRFDLISPIFLRRLAIRLEEGALKYSPRNWEKGMSASRYLDAVMRHTSQILDGETDEDHAAAVAFNIMAYIHTVHKVEVGELPRSLFDLPSKMKESADE
jgi:hypothetical protein